MSRRHSATKAPSEAAHTHQERDDDIAKRRDGFVIAEYNALRAELLKNLEFRFQIVQITLVLFAGIMSVGIPSKSTEIFAVYPVVAAILFCGWITASIDVKRISSYIRDELAKNTCGGMQWESHVLSRKNTKVSGIVVSGFFVGIFVFTQIIATLMALLFPADGALQFLKIEILGFSFGPTSFANRDAYLIVDILCILGSLVAVVLYRQAHGSRAESNPGPGRAIGGLPKATALQRP
jgi:hypothetical protein